MSLKKRSVEVDHQSDVVNSRVVNGNYGLQIEDNRYNALGTAFFIRNQKEVKGIQVVESVVTTERELELPEGSQYYTLHSDNSLVNQVSQINPISLVKDKLAWSNMLEDEQLNYLKINLVFLKSQNSLVKSGRGIV